MKPAANRSDLAAALAQKGPCDLTREQAEKVVSFLVDEMKACAADQGLTLRTFAVFKPTAVAGRERRDPQTGGKVFIESHWRVKVDISPNLREHCTRIHA
jgi:nucleoid DNA-binding protein